ncbi:hypothetical protein LA76x_2139 [Lysobacter antibioticus]|uniref:Uncharacterized protein n=1 Tax=Lysobacter antibioticus TaxID=84531 RepID=A0A0S2F9U4_LYSAN|nr:hypothetical protein LA76x_2139 [Lysobacter antibioticus]
MAHLRQSSAVGRGGGYRRPRWTRARRRPGGPALQPNRSPRRPA